ncbi:Aste57867_14791 [Aphanomyces stellatus]|uniref:Aste57867_14791 protein n=1 Tax=Aphanomyces stellatus TaxID=120398 RepID=A0A485L2F3_9STRA|nr:hypothetical protein As57867_014736 [Aphanomyces stellatus]VFT91609.1 Aste57867_14791 [Aphanomyces stellatus]
MGQHAEMLLRLGKNPAVAGDFEVLFAIDVFKAHITALHAARAASFDLPLRVTTVSSFGLVRERVYVSSAALAASLATFLLEDDMLRHVVADVRGDARGKLTLTSHAHLAWHALHGRLPCSICGAFLKGPKGIRVHQMIQHGLHFASAQEEALASDWQLVVYVPSSASWTSSAPASPTKVVGPMAKIDDTGILAAYAGDLPALEALVRSGTWNPERQDHNGCNALVWAAGAGQLAVCRYLVDSCRLDAAVLQGKRGMRRNALHWAARNGHIHVCHWLVHDLHVPVDAPTADGTTAFHYAVWNQQLAMCTWLVTDGGCDVHRLNSYGCNASQWSCMTGSVPMMEFLASHGLDFTLLNHNGHSALHKAAIKGHVAASRWLLTYGGLGLRHMQEDSDGFTPMSFAVENGHVELGVYLRETFERWSTEDVKGPERNG